MKVTVVPAQVTTVEDRIAGNLGFSQLLLLAAPVFGSGVLFMLIPPVMHSSSFKITLITILTAIFWTLSIRIKGKILLLWIIVILRYNLRPSTYVYDKNSPIGREQYKEYLVKEAKSQSEKKKVHRKPSEKLGIADAVRVLDVINNPAAKVHFETGKKGKLYVRITEIKETV